MSGDIPLHPTIAHFPIALWLGGALWLTAAVFRGERSWLPWAWGCLALGGLFSIAASVSGQQQWFVWSGRAAAEMQNHRNLGILLPWFMVGCVLVRLHLRLSRKVQRIREGLWLIPVWTIVLITGYAAFLGHQLVYREAIGPVFELSK